MEEFLVLSQIAAEMEEGRVNTKRLDLLPSLVTSIKQVTLELQDLEAAAKEKKMILSDMENQALDILIENGMDQFSNKEGAIKVKIRRTTKKPAHGSPEWDDLKQHLKNEGLWEDMATVNANTLNSWYNGQMDLHKDDPTFEVPGCSRKEYTSVKFTRNTK